MIGVIARETDRALVEEFFQLFKVPWEHYSPERHYQVVISTCPAELDRIVTQLLIVYAADKIPYDQEERISIQEQRRGTTLSFAGCLLPILGSIVTFSHSGSTIMVDEDSRQSAAYIAIRAGMLCARIGYDLFYEIEALISCGQPSDSASTPTLDLHIAFLRDLIVSCGIALAEVPPVPSGYPFIACLTHDIDHAFIRTHKLDRTVCGFLYRATLGSAVNLFRKRVTLAELLRNWTAAAKLPLIHLGVAKDFWNEFDRYLSIDKDHPSTFFVIPFTGRSGRMPDGLAPSLRACRYDVSDIADKIPKLIGAGCEIGVHGIDAWLDDTRGREELQKVSEVSGSSVSGVRMHWLYTNADSPAYLEEAGFVYDSTVGYNETVGYRAGTCQVFKPRPGRKLLELPLHIMDTALFYPKRSDLHPVKAWEKLVPMFDNAVRCGGVLTVNWHDRSIAPERCWDAFYVRLIDHVERLKPWFATGRQAVSWFSWRRSVRIEEVARDRNAMRIKLSMPKGSMQPSMLLRVHYPRSGRPVREQQFNLDNTYTHRDVSISGDVDISLSLAEGE